LILATFNAVSLLVRAIFNPGPNLRPAGGL